MTCCSSYDFTHRAEKVMARILSIELSNSIQSKVRLHSVRVRRSAHSFSTARNR